MDSNNFSNSGNSRKRLFEYWKIQDIDLSGRKDTHFKGYVMIPNVLFKCADELKIGGMQSSLFILLQYLISRGYNFCGFCHPGHSVIAEDLHTSPKTVERNLKKLKDAGLIEIEERCEGDKRLSNYYTWNGLFDKLREFLIRDGLIKE